MLNILLGGVIRGKDHAAALCWDNIMQEARSEKSTGVN
jgi:hypothetical protein